MAHWQTWARHYPGEGGVTHSWKRWLWSLGCCEVKVYLYQFWVRSIVCPSMWGMLKKCTHVAPGVPNLKDGFGWAVCVMAWAEGMGGWRVFEPDGWKDGQGSPFLNFSGQKPGHDTTNSLVRHKDAHNCHRWSILSLCWKHQKLNWHKNTDTNFKKKTFLKDQCKGIKEEMHS